MAALGYCGFHACIFLLKNFHNQVAELHGAKRTVILAIAGGSQIFVCLLIGFAYFWYLSKILWFLVSKKVKICYLFIYLS